MDGNLLVEVFSPEQSENLMKMTKLVGREVSVIPHPVLNQCRGVIYAPELLSIDTEEIQSELEEQNVIKVVRMKKKVQDQLIPLPTLILTFSTYKLPTIIKAGWLNFKVKPYIPSPLRCYHCQMYGHLIQKCKRRINQEAAVCQNCGKNAHGECKETPSCIHCGKEHPSSSKNCDKYIYEKEIQAIKVIEKVSFKEARRKALDRHIRPGESFSSVVKNMESFKPQSPTEPIRKPNGYQQSSASAASNVIYDKDPQPPSVSNSSKIVAGNLNTKNGSSVTKNSAGQRISELEPIELDQVGEKTVKANVQPKQDAKSKTIMASGKKDSLQTTEISSGITPKPDKHTRKRLRTPEHKLDKHENDNQQSKKSGAINKKLPKLNRAEDAK